MTKNMTLEEITEFLASTPLFSELTQEALLEIAKITDNKTYREKDVLAKEGEPGYSMFVIVSGEVWVTVRNNLGEEIELAKRGAGDHLGEMAVLSDIPRTATLTALTDVETLEISQEKFEEILLTQPRTSLGIIRELIRRLEESDQRIRAQSEQSAAD